MKNLIFLLLILSSIAYSNLGYAQKTIEGVTIPETFTAGKEKLILNGAGVREKYFIDLYIGALYLKNKSSDANKILESNEPIVIKMHIVSKMITSKKMEETVRDGFKKSTGGNTAPYKEKIDKIVEAFKGEIKVGDVFDIVYIPEEATTYLYKNNKLGSQVKGEDFRKIMFGIWLGKDPADNDLKDDLLGK
ncbi:MAG TPA: chalcone isomerase family protein [Cytophagaceae bacterium]